MFRYPGKIVKRFSDGVLVEAFFGPPDRVFEQIVFRQGDRFRERYFTNRWYNVFEIHDRDTDEIKAWYCNIAEPAILTDGFVQFTDLALDLIVYPGGQQKVLDEEEFSLLELDEVHTRQAWAALDELQRLFAAGVDLFSGG